MFEKDIFLILLSSLEKTPIPLLELLINILLKITFEIGFSPYPTLIPADLEVTTQLSKIIFFASLELFPKTYFFKPDLNPVTISASSPAIILEFDTLTLIDDVMWIPSLFGIKILLFIVI